MIFSVSCTARRTKSFVAHKDVSCRKQAARAYIYIYISSYHVQQSTWQIFRTLFHLFTWAALLFVLYASKSVDEYSLFGRTCTYGSNAKLRRNNIKPSVRFEPSDTRETITLALDSVRLGIGMTTTTYYNRFDSPSRTITLTCKTRVE